MTTTVFYDGQCVICRQTRRIVTALDWLRRVEFVDVHQWDAVEARAPGLDFETAMGQVHVTTAQGLVGGFDGTRAMLRQLPLGFPLWLLLHLPGMSWLGRRVYRFIARHRYRINRWVGAPVCEDGSCRIHS